MPGAQKDFARLPPQSDALRFLLESVGDVPIRLFVLSNRQKRLTQEQMPLLPARPVRDFALQCRDNRGVIAGDQLFLDIGDVGAMANVRDCKKSRDGTDEYTASATCVTRAFTWA